MKKYLKPILFFALGFSTLTLASCSEKEQLVSPQNIIYKGGIISWDPVSNANQYEVKINSEKSVYVDGPCLTGVKIKEDFKVEVTAHNKEKAYVQSNPATQNFHFTEAPKNLRNDNGIIRWDEVEGCTSYEIYDNNSCEFYETSNNYFADYEPSYYTGEYTFQVKTNSDFNGNVESSLSEPISFKSVGAPFALIYDYELKEVTWKTHEDSNGFELKIDDEIIKVDSYVKSYQFLPNDNDKHTLSVRTLSKDSTLSNSPFSEAIYIQKIKAFTREELTFNQSRGNPYSANFEVTYNDCAPNTMIKYGNDEFIFYKTQFEFPLYVGRHEFFIKRVARISEYKNIYYLDSDYVGFTYDVLNPVENLKLSGDRKYITWEPVEGATAYEIYTISEEFTVTENKFDVSKLATNYNSNLIVRAISDKDSVFHSESVSMSYTKINGPKNITVNSVGQITLDHTDYYNYIRYAVEVNGELFESDNRNIFLGNFPADELNIRTKYIGNSEGYLDSNFSETYKFQRIPQVKNLRLEDGVLRFDGNYANNIEFMLWNKRNGSIIDYGHLHEFNLNSYTGILPDDIIGVTAFDTTTQIYTVEDLGKTLYFPSYTSWVSNGISKLPQPKNGKIVGNKILWDAVEGATSYEVIFNSEKTFVTETEFSPKFTSINKENQIRIRAAKSEETNTIKSNPLVLEFGAKPIKGATVLKKVIDFKDYKRFVFEDNFGTGKLLIKDLDKNEFIVTEKREYEVNTHQNATYMFQAFPYNEDIRFYYDYENTPDKYIVLDTPKLAILETENGNVQLDWILARLANEYKITFIAYKKGTSEIVNEETNIVDGVTKTFTRKIDLTNYDYEIKFQARTHLTGPLVYHGTIDTYKLGGNK